MCVGLARAVFCHPPPLMLPTLTANTAVHGRAGGAVPEVCPAEAVRAASNFSDHSGSVLASPQTWLEVRPSSRSTVRNGLPL